VAGTAQHYPSCSSIRVAAVVLAHGVVRDAAEVLPAPVDVDAVHVAPGQTESNNATTQNHERDMSDRDSSESRTRPFIVWSATTLCIARARRAWLVIEALWLVNGAHGASLRHHSAAVALLT
jgi:hypothetical protein